MQCELCRQREATVVWHGKVGAMEFHGNLCAECAAAMTKAKSEDLAGLVDSLLQNGVNASTLEKQDEKGGVECSVCHMRWRDYLASRRLGCSHCYEAFASFLESFLRAWHKGAEQHVGKVPTGAQPAREKAEQQTVLRIRLREAIQAERYEEAARLRDEIKRLSNGPGSSPA